MWESTVFVPSWYFEEEQSLRNMESCHPCSPQWSRTLYGHWIIRQMLYVALFQGEDIQMKLQNGGKYVKGEKELREDSQ